MKLPGTYNASVAVCLACILVATPGAMSKDVAVVSADLDTSYTESASQEQEFQYLYDLTVPEQSLPPGVPLRLRVELGPDEDPEALRETPLRVSVYFEETGFIFSLPMVSGSDAYSFVERTLLVTEQISGAEVSVVISSSTTSIPAEFKLVLSQVEDFHVDMETPVNVKDVGVSSPKYVYVDLARANDDYLLELVVDSNDDVCSYVSIQPLDFPISDQEDTVTKEGSYQTMLGVAAFNVDNTVLGQGAIVAFVLTGTENECRSDFVTSDPDRTKTFQFTLSNGVEKSKVWWLWGSSIIILVVLAVGTFLVSHFLSAFRLDKYLQKMTETICGRRSSNSPAAEEESVPEERQKLKKGYPYFCSDLSGNCSRGEDGRKLVESFKQSELYLWLTFTVGIFYGIPALQLVLHHNYSITESGDQDLCYYNFLCTVQSFNFTNFNNILSNVYYLICGLLFMLLVWIKQRQYYNFLRSLAENPPPEDCELSSVALAIEASNYGISQHFGLFYGMGLSLIAECFFSAFYHVCPSDENFQFDTTFMYIIATLTFMKIYQFRHPDVTSTAYKIFLGIGIVLFFEALGIFYGNTAYWAIMMTLYFLLTVCLIGIVYHPGKWAFKSSIFGQIAHSVKSRWQKEKPVFAMDIPRYHALLVGLLVLLNLLFLISGSVAQPDASSYILNIFIGNLMIYAFYYIGMKIYFKEKITISVYIYGVLMLATGAVAMYYFTRGLTDYTLKPAESRNNNQECILFDIYDAHDVWHMFSAMGLFFCFMMLLNLDDGIFFTPRSEIRVF